MHKIFDELAEIDERREARKILLRDEDAEIDPAATTGGGLGL